MRPSRAVFAGRYDGAPSYAKSYPIQIWRRQPASPPHDSAAERETRRSAHLEQRAQLVVVRAAQEREVDLLRLERLGVARLEPERRKERS